MIIDLTAEQIFNELTWISESWDGEHISFDKDKLMYKLKELSGEIEDSE